MADYWGDQFEGPPAPQTDYWGNQVQQPATPAPEQPWYSQAWDRGVQALDTVSSIISPFTSTPSTWGERVGNAGGKVYDFFADMPNLADNFGTSPLSVESPSQLHEQNVQRWQQQDIAAQRANMSIPISNLTASNPAAQNQTDIVGLYNQLSPDKTSMDFLTEQENRRQAALQQDKDLFNLPYSMPEDRLNAPMIQGSGVLTKGMDIMNIPQQALIGAAIAEPFKATSDSTPSDYFAHYWDAAKQGIRAKVGGRELVESMTGVPINEQSILSTDMKRSSLVAGAALAQVFTDPVMAIPTAWSEKMFTPLGKLTSWITEKSGDILGKSESWVNLAKKVSKYAYRSPEERTGIDMMQLYAEKMGLSKEEIVRDVVLGDTGASKKLAEEFGQKVGVDPSYVQSTLRQMVQDKIGAAQDFQKMDVYSQPESLANLEGKVVPDLMEGAIKKAQEGPAQMYVGTALNKSEPIPGIVVNETNPIEVYKNIKSLQKELHLQQDPKMMLDGDTYKAWQDAIGIPKPPKPPELGPGMHLPEEAVDLRRNIKVSDMSKEDWNYFFPTKDHVIRPTKQNEVYSLAYNLGQELLNKEKIGTPARDRIADFLMDDMSSLVPTSDVIEKMDRFTSFHPDIARKWNTGLEEIASKIKGVGIGDIKNLSDEELNFLFRPPENADFATQSPLFSEAGLMWAHLKDSKDRFKYAKEIANLKSMVNDVNTEPAALAREVDYLTALINPRLNERWNTFLKNETVRLDSAPLNQFYEKGFRRFGSDQPPTPFSLNQIPVIRQQNTKGIPEFSKYRNETFYSLDLTESGKSPYSNEAVMRPLVGGGHQLGGKETITAKISPSNPFILEGSVHSSGPIIHRYGDFQRWTMGDRSEWIKILKESGVPEDVLANALTGLKETGNQSILPDLYAQQLIKNKGFDSILSWQKTDKGNIVGELRMFDTFKDQLKKGSLSNLTDELMTMGQQQKNLTVKMPDEVINAVLAQHRSNMDYNIRMKMIGDPNPAVESDMVDWIYNMVTPEAKKKIVEELGPRGGFKDWSPIHAGMISKNELFKQLKVDEVNPIAKLQGIEIGGRKIKFDKFFEDDLTALETFQRYKAARLENNVQLWADAARTFARDTKDMNPELVKQLKDSGWQELRFVENNDSKYSAVIPQFKGKIFEPEIAKMMNSVADYAFNPETQGEVTRLIEKVRSNWVGGTLYAFPSTMLKNFVGNITNNWINGLKNPDWYEAAATIQRAGKNGGRIKLPGGSWFGGGEYMDINKLRAELNDMVIMGHGYPQEEIRAATEKIGVGRPAIFNLPFAGKALTMGEKSYRGIEDNARVALYLFKRYGEGLTPLQARAEVAKTLFDYVHGLSDFERKLRLYVPFYSWTRFNVPFQVNSLIRNPLNTPYVALSEFIAFQRDNEAARKVDTYQKTVLPAFVKQMGGIPIRMGQDGNPEYLLLGSWVPTMQLETLLTPNGAFDQAYSMIAPYFKIPVEQAFNYDMFREKAIEAYPGQTQEFLGEDVRRRTVHALRFFRFTTELDAMTRGMNNEDFDPMERDAVSRALRFLFGGASVKVNMDYGEAKRVSKIKDTINRLKFATKEKDIEALQQQLNDLTE